MQGKKSYEKIFAETVFFAAEDAVLASPLGSDDTDNQGEWDKI